MCVVRYRSMRRADHSSRGVLPTVLRRCVWSKNLVNEEAMDHWLGGGAGAPKKQTELTNAVLEWEALLGSSWPLYQGRRSVLVHDTMPINICSTNSSYFVHKLHELPDLGGRENLSWKPSSVELRSFYCPRLMTSWNAWSVQLTKCSHKQPFVVMPLWRIMHFIPSFTCAHVIFYRPKIRKISNYYLIRFVNVSFELCVNKQISK